MTTTDLPRFPRAIFDDQGNYTVRTYGRFHVRSTLVARFAALTDIRRDLERAHEILDACRQMDDDAPDFVEESLWNSAIITYGRAVGVGHARTPGFDARSYIAAELDDERLRVHKYVLTLRDKMVAHDDGVGRAKSLWMFLTPTPPKDPVMFGISGGNARVISLGTDIADFLAPHFKWMASHFSELAETARYEIQAELIRTHFVGVELLGPYEEEEIDITIDALVGATGGG
ncbi:hypothetical protein [Marilutibacter spongiae]|uniref:Uncharacterized protein n=1 Tax=Marilutibacter spongiae TaxID=2025720 RepID=A0A7W3TPI9_9GAMM|nr:hypothetical protein [Lysobacter spongiae]MBB1061869.1 hypothetical protein [Lysobacter spongiae]